MPVSKLYTLLVDQAPADYIVEWFNGRVCRYCGEPHAYCFCDQPQPDLIPFYSKPSECKICPNCCEVHCSCEGDDLPF